MKGSCFCGACEFELTGKIGPVGKCHCSKCRTVSGTGSNAVLWAAPEAVTWVKGHIWTSAKPSWDIIGDDAPRFEENA